MVLLEMAAMDKRMFQDGQHRALAMEYGEEGVEGLSRFEQKIFD